MKLTMIGKMASVRWQSARPAARFQREEWERAEQLIKKNKLKAILLWWAIVAFFIAVGLLGAWMHHWQDMGSID
jgi:hypothetical protein